MRLEEEIFGMSLLFFRRAEETNQLARADTRSSAESISNARASCWHSDSPRFKHNSAIGTDFEAAPSDWAGQSQFARRIEKQQKAIAAPIAFSGFPQAGPLADREHLPGTNALHGLIYMKADLDSSYAISFGSDPLNRLHRPGKDVTRTSGQWGRAPREY